jgi:hypothetical protein
MKDLPFRESEAQKLQSYDALCAYLRRASGLVLDSDKRYLVESRIAPIVRREGFSGLTELVRAMERGMHPGLAQEVVQAMTINETYFFRDKLPFDKLREVFLPALITARANKRTLRIWCAASSTGQEPYSIAMIVDELASRITGWRVEIVATDISEAVLTKARAGNYSQFEVQRGLSTAQLLRYFTQNRDVPAVQSARRFLGARQFRPYLLPERAHLFRAQPEGRRAQPHVPRPLRRRRYRAGSIGKRAGPVYQAGRPPAASRLLPVRRQSRSGARIGLCGAPRGLMAGVHAAAAARGQVRQCVARNKLNSRCADRAE